MNATRLFTVLLAATLLGFAGCDDSASNQNAGNNPGNNAQANNAGQNNAKSNNQKNPYSSALEKSRDLKKQIETRSQDIADAIGDDGRFDLSKSGIPDPSVPAGQGNKTTTGDADTDTGATNDTTTKQDAAAKSDTKAGPAQADGDRIHPLPAPDERYKLFLDFNMTDQDGKPFNLKSMVGKPTAITFVFTSCKNAQMCPMQAQKIGWLQDAAAKQGIGEKINLLVITFDPDTDTPEKLRKFVGDNGVEFTNAKALRPKQREFREFLLEFGIRAGVAPNGEIDHQTDMMIFDAAGRRAHWFGGMWSNDTALLYLQQLAAEKKDEPAEKNDDAADEKE